MNHLSRRLTLTLAALDVAKDENGRDLETGMRMLEVAVGALRARRAD